MNQEANEFLHRIIVEQRHQISQYKKEAQEFREKLRCSEAVNAEQAKKIDELTITCAKLSEQNAYLIKKMFGSSSERRKVIVDPDQLSLFDDEKMVETPTAEEKEKKAEEEVEKTVVKEHTRRRRKKPTLEEQFKGAEVEKVYLDSLSDEEKKCPVCGTEMVQIGTEIVRRELQYFPPRYVLREYIAPTYECPKCKQTEDPQFVKDDKCTPALLEKSYVTPSLAAAILRDKFVLSVPFYRQEKALEQSGIMISRASMAGWTIQIYQLYLQYLVEFFHRELLKRHFLMMDETTIQVLKEPDRSAQSKSYVWLMRSGEDGLPPLLLYRYFQTRNGDNAVSMVEGAPKGLYLMADGFQGYNKLRNVKRCTCYAHIRRYFLDAIPKGKEKDLSEPAVQGVVYCDNLFRYERRYREAGLTSEQRYEKRLEDEKPVVEGFIKWLGDQEPSATSSRFNKALIYARNRTNYMLTYLEDGRCSLSNNLSENSIRPVTVGRRNWLFADTMDGAEASMGIYTIVEMAKLHGLEPYKYLKFLLERRPNYRSTDQELESISPWSTEVQQSCKPTM